MSDFPGLQTLTAALQNVVVQIGELTKVVNASGIAIFQGTSSSATAGTIPSPGDFAGFIDVQLPNGTTVKVPYFNV